MDFLCVLLPSKGLLMADPDETAEAPSEDWMEVTAETGVKAC
jgi:hypothetical protein